MSSQEKNRASEEPEVKKNVPAGDTPEANVPERTAEAPAAPESRTDTDAKNPGADIKGPEKQEGPNPLEAELRTDTFGFSPSLTTSASAAKGSGSRYIRISVRTPY